MAGTELIDPKLGHQWLSLWKGEGHFRTYH